MESALVHNWIHFGMLSGLGAAMAGLLFASQEGSGLTVMYPFWAGILVTLYFLYRQYSNFKSKKPDDSIWRFF